MTAQIARLEWKLLVRNRAARYLVIVVPLLATVLAILMLNYPGSATDIAEFLYLACMFVPISYGLLAFSWNATNGASLFLLPVAPRNHIEGRLLILTGLSLPPVIALTASALWLTPGLAALPVTAGLFGVAVASVPFFLVSVKTPRSVDANAPALADHKKFGWQHWVASLLAIAPGIILMRLVPIQQFVALLGVAGLLGLAVLRFTLRYGSRALGNAIPELSDRLLHGKQL